MTTPSSTATMKNLIGRLVLAASISILIDVAILHHIGQAFAPLLTEPTLPAQSSIARIETPQSNVDTLTRVFAAFRESWWPREKNNSKIPSRQRDQ